MPSLSVYNTAGKKVEEMELPEAIFGQPVNQDVMHQAVLMYRASQRQGTASTKERSYVSGGGKKPYRQKGTGQARAGSIRSPLYRGGGVVFGPHPRDFGYSIPKKIRVAALKSSMNSKFKSDNLVCVDSLTVSLPKTKEMVKILSALKMKGKVLALLDKQDKNVTLASRNIPFFSFMRCEDVTAYDILKNNMILFTKTAFKNLLKRIS